MNEQMAGSEYLRGLLEEYDLTSLLDPSLHEMEQKFQGRHLFKYYTDQRRGFFNLPRIRFTQKTALNDRFELTKRWNEFGSAPVRAYLTAVVTRSILKKLEDPNFIVEGLLNEARGRGYDILPEHRVAVSQWLHSSEGEAIVAPLKSNMLNSIPSLADSFFDQLSLHSDAFINEQTRELGIFSVSETETNEQLWALYANEGRGFVVTFDTTHPFFRTGKNGPVEWPLFHKVTYSDDRIGDFWQNPLYLFAVKKKRWSFEEEWRMIKSRGECDEVMSVAGEEIFLCNVVPGMVESITFGYAYNDAHLELDIGSFAKLHPNVRFKRAIVDYNQGSISVVPLNNKATPP